MSNAILTEGLARSFGATRALDGVDLEVPEGTVLGLLGPNGSGKTTTVRILATLLAPGAGTACVAGYDVVREAPQVRRVIGLTGQDTAVDENLTGFENVELIARLLDMPARAARERAAALLERLDLTDAAHRRAKTYSGGMRRRLDLAASLVGRPRVLFLDEPTTGLDPRSRNGIWELIRELVADGTTVLLTTQYLEEADHLADAITVLDEGRVIARGTADELKRSTGGQVLELRPADPAAIDRAAGVLGGLTGGAPSVDRDAGLVGVSLDDASLLAAAVRRLDEAGVAIGDLALRRPSLDEVFLSLTGRPASDAAAPEPPGEGGEPAAARSSTRRPSRTRRNAA
jgi:oleandomycin transport system ATP-binding protein